MSNKQNTTHKKKASNSAPKSRSGNVKSRKSHKTTGQSRATRAPVASTHVLTNNNRSSKVEARSELLFTIPASTSTSFTVVKRIRINPLSRDTFKWIPSVAQNFESFRFRKFHIRYENRCSSATSGSIVISPSYDSADSTAQAATEALLYNNKGTKDFSVWKNQTVPLDIRSMNRLYKSHTCMADERFATTKQDLKTIDPAQVFICIDGVSVNGTTGKIFLDYEVEFFEPHAPTEPPNQGGAYLDSAQASQSSYTPFSTSVGLNLQESVPIIKSLAELVKEGVLENPATAPTGVIGRFEKDWTGSITSALQATSLSGAPALFLAKDPLSLTNNTAPNVNIPLVASIVNGSANSVFGQYKVTALAGDFLKVITPAAITPINLGLQLAGVSPFAAAF